jgi:hypothetical protein
MTTQEKYQGWTNRETWHVNLMWTQDQGSQEWLDDMAREAYAEASADDAFSRRENASFAMAEQLKDHAEENIPHADDTNPPAGWDFYLQFILDGLSEVNWGEIARSRLTPELVMSVESDQQTTDED